jgi:D-glycero-alpha-D-manno-heptose-7-phosphate kinase
MNVLKEPSGKQDPYIAAFGGFMCIDITRNGSTNVYPLRIPPDVASELENNTLFFYTGITREASEVLQSQKNALEENHSEALDAMHSIRDIGFRVKKTLEKGNLTEYGKLQHEHWLAKKRVTNRMSTQLIDRWYNLGLENGAMGGKLMGAGGGGFLMFYCENGKDKLRKAMAEEGLAEVKFGFERNGSKIIINL